MTNREQLLNSKIISASLEMKTSFILRRINDKDKVLDVGCVGQALGEGSKLWLHGLLKEKVNWLTGADIDLEGLTRLQGLGYNVLHINELDQVKFDVIVMGDIIEHIGNIESFLLFYKAKLKEDGKIIITTPNPFSFRQILNISFFKRPFINIEHTCFIDPFTMIEMLGRCQLKLVDFGWIYEHEHPKTFASKLFYTISKFMFRFRRYFSPNFGLVCTQKLK